MSWGHCGGSNLTKVMFGLSLDVAYKYRQAEITPLWGLLQQLFVVFVCKCECANETVCVCVALPSRGSLHSVFPDHPEIFCGRPAGIKRSFFYLCFSGIETVNRFSVMLIGR